MTDWAIPHPRWLSLHARIRRITGRHDAEDLLQAAVQRFLERGQEGVRNPDAYLVRSARNLAVDQARRERHGAVAPYEGDDVGSVPCPSPQPDAVLMARQRLQRLREGCAQLDARTREIFLLHRLEGLSYRDIALRLEISVSAVEKHVSKAIGFLTEWVMD
ncbi:RNA polymerase sigma-24 factor [Gluconacetobacter johannae DSM 13595]|uniref:RNA polymerase sigma factor n=1 Tax=Gluconacetobacter johannae TaxID=112140 RepID=UPI002156836F|nr:sigma-70 family RNA polymerase sigma factor [Gluconacetobacter johannae]GBQ88164.1 RNA polymerase sigma-24 factor [Gluconacetobacter johannae DSM 13595]